MLFNIKHTFIILTDRDYAIQYLELHNKIKKTSLTMVEFKRLNIKQMFWLA